MLSRPTGTVTFLFTDIEGSTRHWEEHRAWMEHAFARQEQIIREAAAAHDGYVYKMVGDAFQIAFCDAGSAAAAAIDAQRALQAENWGDCGPLRVRMALHTGVTEERGDDYVGPTLNRVARLLSAGYGGQILLSVSTYGLVQDQPSDTVTFRDLGVHRLKDIEHPEHIYQIMAPDLADEFPCLKTQGSISQNLPVQLTSFIGRSRETRQIKEHLKVTRLLTLTGPGGTGKTRLALEVAGQVMSDYPDGVFFVGLAPIVDPSLVLLTIAQTLGVRDTQGVSTRDQLRQYLRPKQMLLLLDNFEQVQAAAPLVSDLLADAPHLRVMITSRVLLRVSGEVNYTVPPFALPDAEHLGGERLEEAESLLLFAERARAVKPGFAINGGNVHAVAQICARLDGLPLAIELAAARIRLLPPQQILAQLKNPLAFLTGGPRDQPERQQTLRRAIEWSYNLLAEEERQLFRRMAVFVDGATLEAIQAICRTPEEPEDLLGRVSALVDGNLLSQKECAGGECRFTMLETIREFASEALAACGELPTLQDHHCAYYGKFLRCREARLIGREQAAALEEIGNEIGNLRAGWDWAVENGKAEMLRDYVESTAEFYRVRGAYHEGEQAFERAARSLNVAEGDNARPEIRMLLGSVLLQQGRFLDSLGAVQKSQRLVERSLSIFRSLGMPREVARALCCLGGCDGLYGGHADFPDQGGPCHEALAIYAEMGDQRGSATALRGLGWAALHSGEYALALQRLTESVAIYREMEDQEGLVQSLAGMGYAAWVLGDYSRARELHQEMHAICQAIGDRGEIAHAVAFLGIDAAGFREFPLARELFSKSLALYREIANPWGIADELGDLGEVAIETEEYAEAAQCAQASLATYAKVTRFLQSWELRVLGAAQARLGELEQARVSLRGAIEQSRAARQPGRQLGALVGVAYLYDAEGRGERALELLALARHHRSSWQYMKDNAALLSDKIKVDLPPNIAAAAEARGREIDLQQTIDQILGELAAPNP